METTRASLLIRIKDLENQSAWREFDSIYRPLLKRYARTAGVNEADAEDIAQQCLIGIQQHAADFEYDPSKGRFKNWLRTMAKNRVRNWFRGKKERIAETWQLELPQAPDSPENEFDRLWMEEHLYSCLKQIRQEEPPEVFEAYERYTIKEEPSEDVCKVMGINSNRLYKIKWRLTRRLGEKMRDLLGEDAV